MVSNTTDKSTATHIVRFGGFIWLNPIAMYVVNYSRAEVVEWSGLKPCWSGADLLYLLIVGRIRDSSTFAAGQRNEIGWWVVPREVSLPGFGQWRLSYHRDLTCRDWEVERGGDVFDRYSEICVCPRQKLLLFTQLLIALFTRSAVNVCAISKVFLLVSLVTNRVPPEEVCLPIFNVLNCWLNLLASCFDDENELPLKVITLFCASRFVLPSIPLMVLHSLVTSVFWSKVSTKSLNVFPLSA